jgi:hypothetical protein
MSAERADPAGQHGPKGARLPILLVALFLLLLGSVALVAVLRAPPGDIPAVIRALGSWWHLSLRL